MEGLGTSPNEELLWTVPPLQPGRLSWRESAIPPGDSGQRHPHSELEGLRSTGVGVPWGKEIHWRSWWPGTGSPLGDQSWRSPTARLKALVQLEGQAPSRKD